MKSSAAVPQNKTQDLYHEMFLRNQPIISQSTQDKLRQMRILIAGCGSTGGAFIEGASRVGVMQFRLVDTGDYELNNLNRQFVYPQNIGMHKATTHAYRLQQLFGDCGAELEVEENGVNASNVDRLIHKVDVVFDAVDVTTESGMKAKLLLHERAAEQKLLCLSALDLGFKQWIRVYDYRRGGEPLDGHMPAAKAARHPLKALIEGFCPPEELSHEISEELIRLFKDPKASACQLGAACHLLAAFASPMLIRISEGKTLPKITAVDLMRTLETETERELSESKRIKFQKELSALLATIQ